MRFLPSIIVALWCLPSFAANPSWSALLWTNNGSEIVLVRQPATVPSIKVNLTNGIAILDPQSGSAQIKLSQGDISLDVTNATFPGGSSLAIDMAGYRKSNGAENEAVLVMSVDATGYGGGAVIDPAGDYGFDQPFYFSSSYSNTVAPSSILFAFANSHTNKVFSTGDGTLTANRYVIAGTTNQIIFGATNTAPVSAIAPTKWVSVQVSGESAVYRLPLYQ